ncbi:MAG: PQQ-dependent sugar dehydrogenase [Polyangiaceae bacterium]
MRYRACTSTLCAAGLALLAGCSETEPDPSGPGAGSGLPTGSGTSSSSSGQPPTRLALAFESVPYPTELSYVTDMAFAPGGSNELIVADLYGGYEVARMTEAGVEVVSRGKADDVYAEYDAGQLALAVDPSFEETGYFYLAANLARNHVVVRRYTLDREDPAGTVASAVVVFEVLVPSSPRWHNITSMGFDEQGIMWMLSGDKGLGKPTSDPETGPGQDETEPLGALLRVLPSAEGGYTVPESVEPYSSEAHPAVVAIGIRSPWQGVYHAGRWIYGEVGLDAIEEINVIEGAGQNFGWPVVEGPCALDLYKNAPDCSQFADPFIHFDRSRTSPYTLDDADAEPTSKRSVYAGWVYEPNDNDRYAGLWNDVLVFGDAFVGFMRAAPLGGSGESWHLGHLRFPSAWAQGPDGYVYAFTLSEEPSAKDPQDVSGRPSPLWRATLAQ